MEGWIKIHRSITEHWIYENPKLAFAWMDILLHAGYKERKVLIKGKLYDLKPGQLAWSQHSLSKRWGCSRPVTKSYLTRLVEDHMILLHSDTKTTIITVLNWDKYQTNGTTPFTTVFTTPLPQNDHAPAQTRKEEGEEQKEQKRKKIKDARPENLDEVVEYIKTINGDDSDASAFYDYYVANGWVQGKSRAPIKDWRATARNWMRRKKEYRKQDNSDPDWDSFLNKGA